MNNESSKLKNKEFLEKELQRLNEVISFIKLKLREIDNFKYSWLWEKFLVLSLFCKRLWRSPLFRFILLGTSTAILSFLVADYLNLFEFFRSASPMEKEEVVPQVDPPQKPGLFSKIRKFIVSLGVSIYKVIEVILLVGAGFIGGITYEDFYKSEDAPFDRENIDQENSETVRETDRAPEADTAQEASALIPPKKDVATQTIEVLPNRDLIEAPQTQQLIDVPSERSMRTSSVLIDKLEQLIANDLENSGLKDVKDLQDPEYKEINDLVYKVVVKFLNSENQNDINNSNFDDLIISCDEERILDLKRSDQTFIDSTRGAIEEASSSTSQNATLANFSNK